MIDLSIRKVRSFVCVAELKSFRRAAEKLHISSSALSTHIREIEEAFGVPLLHRTTRSVSLTTEGMRFFSRSQDLISGIDTMIGELRNASTLQRGRLTIACVPTLAESILPRAMTVLAQRYPAIALRILDRGSREIARSLEDGEANFGIMPPPEHSKDFEITPLIEEPLVVVVPRNHPFAKRTEVRFAELEKFPFISLKSSTSVRFALESAAREAGVVLSPAFELVHHYSAGGLVQAGLGITILPSMTMPMSNLPGLVSVPIVAPRVTRTIGVIRRKGDVLSPAAKEFLTVLMSVVSDLGKAKAKPRTVAHNRAAK